METWNTAEHGRPAPCTFTGTICQCWDFLSSCAVLFLARERRPTLPGWGLRPLI